VNILVDCAKEYYQRLTSRQVGPFLRTDAPIPDSFTGLLDQATPPKYSLNLRIAAVAAKCWPHVTNFGLLAEKNRQAARKTSLGGSYTQFAAELARPHKGIKGDLLRVAA